MREDGSAVGPFSFGRRPWCRDGFLLEDEPRCRGAAFCGRRLRAARAADRYAPAAHTLTEALLPTTCVVVNKPPALKHFPTTGAAPRLSESRSRVPRNRRSAVPVRSASLRNSDWPCDQSVQDSFISTSPVTVPRLHPSANLYFVNVCGKGFFTVPLTGTAYQVLTRHQQRKGQKRASCGRYAGGQSLRRKTYLLSVEADSSRR